MAATIPTLRSFIRGYEKAMGWESSYYIKNTNNTNPHSTYRLSTMQKSQHEEDGEHALQRQSTFESNPLRPDRGNYKAKVYGPVFRDGEDTPKRTKSHSSGDSEAPIIRKEVEFQIRSESAR